MLAGLSAEQKTFLAQNGFVVMHSQEAQFGDIRSETGDVNGQPYYLTTDAAFHALHLTFDRSDLRLHAAGVGADFERQLRGDGAGVGRRAGWRRSVDAGR